MSLDAIKQVAEAEESTKQRKVEAAAAAKQLVTDAERTGKDGLMPRFRPSPSWPRPKRGLRATPQKWLHRRKKTVQRFRRRRKGNWKKPPP